MRANWIGGAVVLMLVSVGSAWGEDRYWNNVGGGDWFDPGNWTSGVPLVNDNAYIDNGGTAWIDGGVTERAGHVWVGYDNSGGMELVSGTHKVAIAFVGGNSGALGEYEMIGGDLEASTLIVGSSGQGVFTQTGGTVDCNNTVGLGSENGAEGTYTITGSAFLETDDLTLATWGIANFVQNGGSVVVKDYFRFAWGDTGAGTYTLRGGSLNADDPGGVALIGIKGTGQFLQEGGEASFSSLCLGQYLGSSGTYTLNEGQMTSSSITVGCKGTGSFTQTGGICSTEHLAVPAGNSYILSGGSLTVTDSIEITGTFDLGGGNPSISVGGIADFATITNAGAPSLTVAANSLAYFGSDFDPYTEFASITNNGLIHQRGSALTIGPSAMVRGRGNIYDHVNVQGELSTPDSYQAINVLEGIFVSGGGKAHLGEGKAVIENEISGMSGGELWMEIMYVGKEGNGRFIHSGGLTKFEESYVGGSDLYVGFEAGSSGYYELTGKGVVQMEDIFIGGSGTGRFIQNAGTVLLTYSSGAALHVGGAGGDGYYELNSGEISAPQVFINGGTLRQRGGLCNATFTHDGIQIGTAEGLTATYELLCGTVTTRRIEIGARGEGHFLHSGGTVTVKGPLEIATRYHETATGTYELSGDGTLVANRMTIGGAFLQDGGSVDVDDKIQLASSNESANSALYRISAGNLNVPEMYVGADSGSSGTFDIAGASSEITISERLTVNPTGVIHAVPGATIHMTGSIFENESTDPAAVAGLENIRFIFEGGPAQIDTFEIAGRDMGDDPDGFLVNFAIDTLQLGGSNVGLLRLTDLFDNQADGQEVPEALYVRDLTIGPGCLLDLNGINLYYVDGDIHPLGQFIGGVPTKTIPEPASLILLAWGAAFIARRKRR